MAQNHKPQREVAMDLRVVITLTSRAREEVGLGPGVTEIPRDLFRLRPEIASVTIPEGVTTIEESAFQGCTSLVSVTLPEGVTEIGWSAFQGCTSLASITLPEGVTTIEESAFYGCTSLASITIPAGVTAIGGWAFRDCTSLASIRLPFGLKEIGENAFRNCASLFTILVPTGVESIEMGALSECPLFYLEIPSRFKPALLGFRVATSSVQPYSSIFHPFLTIETRPVTLFNHPTLLLVKLTPDTAVGEAKYIAGTRLVQLKNRIDQVRGNARAIEAAPVNVTSKFPLRFVTDTILRSPDLPMTPQLRKYYKEVALRLKRFRIPVVVVKLILNFLFNQEPKTSYYDWTRPAPPPLMDV